MDRERARRKRETERHRHHSGGALKVPRTPVEKVVLRATLLRLKRDFERRQRKLV